MKLVICWPFDSGGVQHALERRIDRTFYLLLAAMIVLNGDKVLAVLNALLRLLR